VHVRRLHARLLPQGPTRRLPEQLQGRAERLEWRRKNGLLAASMTNKQNLLLLSFFLERTAVLGNLFFDKSRERRKMRRDANGCIELNFPIYYHKFAFGYFNFFF
jgi:hypothetical protein